MFGCESQLSCLFILPVIAVTLVPVHSACVVICSLFICSRDLYRAFAVVPAPLVGSGKYKLLFSLWKSFLQ